MAAATSAKHISMAYIESSSSKWQQRNIVAASIKAPENGGVINQKLASS